MLLPIFDAILVEFIHVLMRRLDITLCFYVKISVL